MSNKIKKFSEKINEFKDVGEKELQEMSPAKRKLSSLLVVLTLYTILFLISEMAAFFIFFVSLMAFLNKETNENAGDVTKRLMRKFKGKNNNSSDDKEDK